MRPTILHVAPTPFFSDRGCHVRIAGIVRCLRRLGARDAVCTYHLGYDPMDIETRRIGPVAGYTKTSAGPSLHKPWADAKLLLLGLRTCRELRPDVLHAHLHEGVMIALCIRACFPWRRLSVVADMQGSLVGELETYGFFRRLPVLKGPFGLLERILLRLSSRVVCSSDAALELFRERYPAHASKITLVQDGGDHETSLPADERDAVRASLGVLPGQLCLIYTGALIESKGLAELQALLLACRDDAARLHVVVVGYPVDALSRFVSDEGLEALCTLTGRVAFADLGRHLAAADIALDTKNADAGEGSGKTLNYLASGLPVLAFDTPNNRRFLGADAPLADSVKSLYQTLRAWMDDPEARRAAADANGRRYRAAFSWDVSRDQLADAYAALPDTPFAAGSSSAA